MADYRAQFGVIASIICVACAVFVTGAVVRRELRSDAPAFRPRSIRDYAPVPFEDWDILISGGRRIGPDSALLTIVEFGDFQCPACKQFHETALSPLLERYEEDVALIFRHWPLPYHPEALASAKTAECAAEQGRFAAIVDALYKWQDSLAHLPPDHYARIAGVPDELLFERCIAADNHPAIDNDIILATRLGGVGTPTLIINGQFLRYVPDSSGLEAIFRQAQKGQLTGGSATQFISGSGNR